MKRKTIVVARGLVFCVTLFVVSLASAAGGQYELTWSTIDGGKGLGSGVSLGTGEFDHDVAHAGRVYCNVDTTQACIESGALLTTSATPGYAMKAMESLQKGDKGQILVLVTLQ